MIYYKVVKNFLFDFYFFYNFFMLLENLVINFIELIDDIGIYFKCWFIYLFDERLIELYKFNFKIRDNKSIVIIMVFL